MFYENFATRIGDNFYETKRWYYQDDGQRRVYNESNSVNGQLHGIQKVWDPKAKTAVEEIRIAGEKLTPMQITFMLLQNKAGITGDLQDVLAPALKAKEKLGLC